MIRILTGDCRDTLRDLPDESVHCVVTSPPYFGLRDYQTGTWDGGDPDCGHVVGEMRRGLGLADSVVSVRGGGHKAAEVEDIKARQVCPHCGARRNDRQLGREETPAEYVAAMVDVFREVRRVLRKDGTCWLNIGDSYSGSGKGRNGDGTRYTDVDRDCKQSTNRGTIVGVLKRTNAGDIRPKELIGIPWMLAFALRADGWRVRQEIIWSKPNAMPESVGDRCTKAHEQLFLLTKSEDYYFDNTAIAEAAVSVASRPDAQTFRRDASKETLFPGQTGKPQKRPSRADAPVTHTRNKRSVWTIATKPFAGAHFAVMPTDLVEPCIKAGTSERGVCGCCGAPWARIIERRKVKPVDYDGKHSAADPQSAGRRMLANARARRLDGEAHDNPFPAARTIDWKATCDCAASLAPAMVLDPFGGAGTVGLVASRLGRDATLLELNPEFAAMARKRIEADSPLFAQVAA